MLQGYLATAVCCTKCCFFEPQSAIRGCATLGCLLDGKRKVGVETVALRAVLCEVGLHQLAAHLLHGVDEESYRFIKRWVNVTCPRGLKVSIVGEMVRQGC
jgi:hypothetical protein